MSGTLKINDLVTFSYLSHRWAKVKDDYEGGLAPQRNPGPTHISGLGTLEDPNTQHQQQQQNQQGLIIEVAATHAGIITRNNGFYLPEKMRKGAETFTKDYQKPILLHHDDHADAIGRVVQASYVDTSGVIQDKYRGRKLRNSAGEVTGEITDQFIQDFVGGQMPFGSQVDLVRTVLRDSELLEDQGYQGLGYIKLLANITDPEAIQKFLDGRYLTGSVGATTDKAVCSICRTDWTDGGPCDHSPGGVYDDAKCFIIAGALSYDEYSVVNKPADRHSRVLQLNYNGNQQDIEIKNDYKGRIHEVQLEFPLYDSDNKEEKRMAKDAKNNNGNLDVKDSATSENSDTNKKTQDQETQVTDSKETSDTENIEDDKSSENTQNTEVADGKNTDESGNEVDVEDNKVESVSEFLDRILDGNRTDELSEEDEQKAYDILWDEVLTAKKDGVIADSVTEDAKLSSEERKKLPKSSFCGPSRLFPVSDCTHIVAARRLIDNYEGSGNKKEIVACIDRKSKAMGCCGKEKKSNKVTDSIEQKDNLDHTRVMRSILNLLEDDSYWNNEPVLEDEEKKMLQNILKRLSSRVTMDAFVSAAVEAGLIQDETTLLDEVAKNEETIGELRESLDATRKEYHLLFKDVEELKDELTDTNIKLRQTKESHLKTLADLKDCKVDDRDFTSLSDSDINSEIDKTMELVDMVKITDKLGDGMSRNPQGTVDDPNEIQDNTNNTNDDEKKIPLEQIIRIQEHYQTLLFKNSVQAENYRQDMIRRGYLPRDLNNIQGGSN